MIRSSKVQISAIGSRTRYLALCLAAIAGGVFGQCPETDATLPNSPLSYPKTSDRYAVQY